MNIETYYHIEPEEAWNNVIITDVVAVIEHLEVKIVNGCSSRMRQNILEKIRQNGWSSNIKITYDSNISITAMNGKQALCLQTGNMSRFYADLLKLQYLYTKSSITSAIYIIPSKQCAKLMGSNLAHFDRLVEELRLFTGIITVPMFVIGIS